MLRRPPELEPVKGSALEPRSPHPGCGLQIRWRGSTGCQEPNSRAQQAALAGAVVRGRRGGQERSSFALCGIVS